VSRVSQSHPPVPPEAARAGRHSSAEPVRASGASATSGMTRSYAAALLVVAVVAFTLRLVPLLTSWGLAGLYEYDDAVHFSTGIHLVDGVLPYRDFHFLQPPGIALLLAPFAWLGRAVGETTAFEVARVAWMLLGAANAVLVCLVTRRYGERVSLVCGLLYAVWAISVGAAHTMMIEPVVSALTLLGLLALGVAGSRPHPVWAGLLLGSAVSFKLWAAVGFVVVLALVAARLRSGAAWRFVAAGAAGAAALALPMLVSPANAWHDVVVTQAQRPRNSTPLSVKLGWFVTSVDVPTGSALAWVVTAGAVIALVLVGLPLLGALAQRRAPTVWADSAWWSLWLIALAATLALAPTFYYHYLEFFAVPACLLVGAVLKDRARWLDRGAGLLAVAGVAALLAWAAWAPHIATRAVAGPLRQDTPGCIWSDDPNVLIEAGLTHSQLQRGCPAMVDYSGSLLADGIYARRTSSATAGRALDDEVRIRAQVLASQVLVLRGAPDRLFDPTTGALVRSRFVLQQTFDGFQYWIRKGAAGP